MLRAPVNGTELAYEVAGTDGAPVVLIMGLGSPGGAWSLQLLGLQDHHRVLTFDHRCVGKSAAPSRGYSSSNMARDVVGLMDHLGWNDAHVVGISMGGMIAQHIGLDFRHRTRSLTLVATHAGGIGTRPVPRRTAWMLATSHFVDDQGSWERVRDSLFPRDFVEDPNAEAILEGTRSVFANKSHPRKWTTLRHLRTVFGHRAIHRLHELEGLPTLVIRAGRDVLIPSTESLRLHRAIPGSRLYEFPEAGHGVNAQHPEEFNNLLREHFDAADAGPSTSNAPGANGAAEQQDPAVR